MRAWVFASDPGQEKLMATTTPDNPPLELEPTSPEVKGYQRQKLAAMLASMVLSLAYIGFLALVGGPVLGTFLSAQIGDCPWLRLTAMALVVGVGLEVLTAPIDFWSGFLVEHRYQLSNQTFGAWLWQRTKGYLVGGVIGLGLLLGLYAVLWSAGTWWWLWATAGWLLATLVLGRLLPVLPASVAGNGNALRAPGGNGHGASVSTHSHAE